MLYKYGELSPQISENVFVAPGAQVVGNVILREGANVWFNAVIRGDLDQVVIGKKTNIQDGSMCHVDDDHPLYVGDNVTVGHGAILHGCTIKDKALVGMGATILNGAVIGENAIIAAGALVAEGKEVPANSVVMGVPGKVVKEMSDEEVSELDNGSESYYKKAMEYLHNLEESD